MLPPITTPAPAAVTAVSSTGRPQHAIGTSASAARPQPDRGGRRVGPSLDEAEASPCWSCRAVGWSGTAARRFLVAEQACRQSQPLAHR